MDIYGAVCWVPRRCGYPAKETSPPASRSPPPLKPRPPTPTGRQLFCSPGNLISGKQCITKPCQSALSILFLTLVMSLTRSPSLWVMAIPVTAQLGNVFPSLPLSYILAGPLWPMGCKWKYVESSGAHASPPLSSAPWAGVWTWSVVMSRLCSLVAGEARRWTEPGCMDRLLEQNHPTSPHPLPAQMWMWETNYILQSMGTGFC